MADAIRCMGFIEAEDARKVVDWILRREYKLCHCLRTWRIFYHLSLIVCKVLVWLYINGHR